MIKDPQTGTAEILELAKQLNQTMSRIAYQTGAMVGKQHPESEFTDKERSELTAACDILESVRTSANNMKTALHNLHNLG